MAPSPVLPVGPAALGPAALARAGGFPHAEAPGGLGWRA
jgi:hypothetical protein